MSVLIQILKSIVFGIVEGITEWLPISSTGHLILLNAVIPLTDNAEFWDMYKYIIQLGAILAVVVLYFKKLWPFCAGTSCGRSVRKRMRRKRRIRGISG